ncbi:hypothetical protein [Methylotenera sp.]|uniref:hypothetical protein n=1 Tax=Methylotenera sp. TaxID=2051956 RepID=UPI00248A5DFE|nr:hypothetical protein [Methylotenera sp.]MDI1362500.1 hypothetical protein [Methylotenera sp.]
MFKNISLIFKALNQGESLFHVETWKNVQLVTNAITAILMVVVVFVPQLNLTPETIQDLASGIALIGGVINGYLTVATTKKIGLGNAPIEPTELHNLDTATDSVPAKDSLDGGSKLLSGK